MKRSKPLVITLLDAKNKVALEEPNIRQGESAVFFTPKLSISDLKPQTTHTLYSWDDIKEFPLDSNYEESNWINKKEFKTELVGYSRVV